MFFNGGGAFQSLTFDPITDNPFVQITEQLISIPPFDLDIISTEDLVYLETENNLFLTVE